MKRIEHYDNYRDFMRDYFEDRKRRFTFFSNRYFCQKAGIKSPSLYQEVVEGKRNLTETTIPCFIKGMGLTEKDAAFFSLLVHLNQCKTEQERALYVTQLKQLQQKVHQEMVPAEHYAYYANWYNPVIRELACILDWGDNYDLLARAVNPCIKKREARESVNLLLRLGFLTRDSNGKYFQGAPAITSGSHVHAAGVRHINKQFSELGTQAIETFDSSLRHISSMTVGVSEASFRQINQEIEEFKDRLRRIVDDDKATNSVYTVNIHFFPVSTKKKES